MTAVIEETEFDWTVLIDFEEEVTCEHPSGCDAETKWIVGVKCCNVQRLLCDWHKKNEEEISKDPLRRCINCKTSPAEIWCRRI